MVVIWAPEKYLFAPDCDDDIAFWNVAVAPYPYLCDLISKHQGYPATFSVIELVGAGLRDSGAGWKQCELLRNDHAFNRVKEPNGLEVKRVPVDNSQSPLSRQDSNCN